MSDIGQTRPTPSVPNNAYQISGQNEFKALKELTFRVKMLCNPWLVEAATTQRGTLGKPNMSVSHCYEKNDMISTWYFSFFFFFFFNFLCWMFAGALSFIADALNTGLCCLELSLPCPDMKNMANSLVFIPSAYSCFLSQEHWNCQTADSYLELDKYR